LRWCKEKGDRAIILYSCSQQGCLGAKGAPQVGWTSPNICFLSVRGSVQIAAAVQSDSSGCSREKSNRGAKKCEGANCPGSSRAASQGSRLLACFCSTDTHVPAQLLQGTAVLCTGSRPAAGLGQRGAAHCQQPPAAAVLVGRCLH